MILHLISYFHECTALFWAKMVTFCIIHIGNRKSQLILSHKCSHILHNICEKLVGTPGWGIISHSPKCDVYARPNISIWIFGVLS